MRFNRGFTLVEMIVTFVILAVLAMAAMPIGETVVRRSKERELKDALREVRRSIDRYKEAVEEGRILAITPSGYPPSLQALVDGAADLKQSGARIHFLRRIPVDPFCADARLGVECWQRRSYASSASDPRPGADVYDIYSTSSAIGSDGRKYSEW